MQSMHQTNSSKGNEFSGEIAMIVATDENNAIGKKGNLLCHLPNDLKHFKQITEHHTVVMGRKTFESLPKGALPNRKNIVMTSQKDAKFTNCIVCHSLDEVWQHCENEDKVFFIGGEQIYKLIIDKADTLYLTRIHHAFPDADTFFPAIDPNEWILVKEKQQDADDKHPFDYTFFTYIRKKQTK
jgi:dihydrofolate reductase